MATVYQNLLDAIVALRDEAFTVTEYLTAHPETGGREELSSRFVTEFLERHGYTVEHDYKAYRYAFRAYDTDDDRPKAAIMCEYDALPEIGHGCGHSLSCGISVLTALSLREAFPDFPWQIELIGTPAEETDGAKCPLAVNGAFDCYDFAAMCHMDHLNAPIMWNLACNDMTITLHGKTAHASASPWEGINAMEAAELIMHGVSLLRARFKPFMQVHGIVEEGGTLPNIVPDKAVLNYYTRALNLTELAELRRWVRQIVRGVSVATGVTYEITQKYPTFAELYRNPVELSAIEETFEDLGRPYGRYETPGASTDAGNVDMLIPTIHMEIQASDPDISLHTAAFESFMHGDRAKETLQNGASALATVLARLGYEDGLFDSIKTEHDRYRDEQRVKLRIDTGLVESGGPEGTTMSRDE
ncbi:amidohydrolase [Bifidobacterium lemurum]|uniref:Peptidase M20 domain-containing protein 2 n=1 Tax=Bifidobacterium lemurum TaxID=1603886 RepID=A0A261FU06_9BIFI|nr:M20/M25/M40 family metallo-hydrolase [Bifidobacterium lemurum]OZG62662.1 amidohydrolase [Bifidobacterium lemurum]QOL34616.1 M20/M25/M40 family metallo-hydrolase [Bifidobacterium lemurum]